MTRTWMTAVLFVGLGCSRTPPAEESHVAKEPSHASAAPTTAPAPSPPVSASPVAQQQASKGGVVITDRAQREAAVDREVTVIGILTRTKVPTVVGIDVGDAYDLSDKKVIVRGVLKRTVIDKDPNDNDAGIKFATRGAGTFYSLVNPDGKGLAKPALHE